MARRAPSSMGVASGAGKTPRSIWVGTHPERAEPTLGRGRATGFPMAPKDEGEAHRDRRPEDRADHIDPRVAEVPQHQIGSERAGRVHRRAADRARPQASQDEVRADPQRRQRTQVLGLGRRPQDHAEQPDRQDQLHHHRLAVADPGPGPVAPNDPTLPNIAHNTSTARVDPSSSATMYPGTRRQGKSPRRAKPRVTAGFRWAPLTAPMNKMIARTIRPGAVTPAPRPMAPWLTASTTPPPRPPGPGRTSRAPPRTAGATPAESHRSYA